jgi:outer membrane protein OmpU
MNNFKKIGMTALAASLVSTSVFAGELTASGSASVTAEGWSGTTTNKSRALSMADSVVLSGSTELDNGMTVSMSFELDSDNPSGSSYDDKSVTIASDTLGTFKFSGHGGSTAASAMDATAAGDLWDNFDSTTETSIGQKDGIAVKAAAGGNNSLFYTLPSMVDGLAVTASYRPASSTALETASATAYGITYTGVEGLSASFGVADVETGTASSSGDQTVMKASYAYGPVTIAYSSNEYDVDGTSNDQDTTSWNVSYTLTDSISIGYGDETIETPTTSEVDAEYSGFNASYTAGGMTVTAKMIDAENIDHGATAASDGEYWSLGLSFAF